jgi:hypothetical protein
LESNKVVKHEAKICLTSTRLGVAITFVWSLEKTIKDQNAKQEPRRFLGLIGSPEVFVERFVDPPQEQRGKVIAFPSELKESA